MTVDYKALQDENRKEYGQAIGRIGKMLLEDRYDKRTHFIYEVLQNAEDALRRRECWTGSRVISFQLSPRALRISHFGAPFTEADVRGLCGINSSTKDVTSIGRFGIGFKSVYAFTDRPEIYSGAEAFSISEYVFPEAISEVGRIQDETIIVLPLREDDTDAFAELADGLRTLGAESLLFLKHVDEISWQIEDGESGSYRRSKADGGLMQQVKLITTVEGSESQSEYLLFSRDVQSQGQVVGQAELAFMVAETNGRKVVQPISDARLFVFFPTVLPTHTGFLIQGPYQTTPSRDNIPTDKPWNIQLAKSTGQLLVDALKYLQKIGTLDVALLQALPLERRKMAGGLFEALFESMVNALKEQRLLPTNSAKYARASELRLSRAQEVRELFNPKQLAALLGKNQNIFWASGEITSDRTPQLRIFLIQELSISELTLDQMLSYINDEFLSEQSDAWIVRFYKLLASQPALMRGRAKDMALFRLEDGRHVPLIKNGVRQVFLPSSGKTDFPTLRSTILNAQTRKFLESAGLTEPDPVDDVIQNLLPNYRKQSVDTTRYADDITRMLQAFQTDSQAQRDKLLAALRLSSIVRVKDAASGDKFITKPPNAYLAVSRLTKLFLGVEGVFFVNTEIESLRGEKIREMLEACGSTRILRTAACNFDISENARRAARRAAGWEGCSSEQTTNDVDVVGLSGLLKLLPNLPFDEQRSRAKLLWEAVGELVDRRGPSVLSIQYTWFYHQTRATMVDSKLLRRLNETPWIPVRAGELRLPSEVLFEDLDWPANPFLQSRIAFKAPAIAALAREVGIDLELIDELKRLGVTDLAKLRDRLGEQGQEEQESRKPEASVAAGASSGDGEEEAPLGSSNSNVGGRAAAASSDHRSDESHSRGTSNGGGTGSAGYSGGASQKTSNGGEREFISYIGVRSGSEHSDPDGLTQSQRMDLEEKAIDLIINLEPILQRTPPGNTGYDLIENDLSGEPQRWIEVKAMKGTLTDRPVGMSSAQMEQARRCGDQFWLYIVERAGTADARVLKIRNPHGAAGTYTFDRGWAAIATV